MVQRESTVSFCQPIERGDFMLQKISSTFGSRAILTDYLKKQPQHPMILLKPAAGDEAFQLLDISGQASFFKNPLHYTVRYQTGSDNWHGFFNFMYLTFPSMDAAKVFLAKFGTLAANQGQWPGCNNFYLLQLVAPKLQYVILSIWQNEADYFNWRKSAEFKPLRDYLKPSVHLQQVYQATYSIEQAN